MRIVNIIIGVVIMKFFGALPGFFIWLALDLVIMAMNKKSEKNKSDTNDSDKRADLNQGSN